eukprot:jgi/Psemu1/291121/fgenesh1_pg.629_\
MEAIVEIDENERYWVGGGFGRRGLLPNDRGPFSTADGSMVWKSPDEASEDLVLLGRGWNYEKEGFKPTTQWMYATDFRAESVKNAKPNRGMMHFVRFRRLYRTKIFNPDEFVDRNVSEKCAQVDSSATNALGRLLLDTLAYCSLLHNPKAYTDATTLPLKERIINIAIRQPENSNGPTSSDAFYQLDQLRIKLEKFIESEQARTGQEDFEKREAIVSRQCFSQMECDAISTLIVKNLDPGFQLHCELPNCGEECKFFRVPCTNDGCPLTMSRLYVDEHDSQCPYKIIKCKCGDRFPRHQLETHNAQVCKMRDVECPYRQVGCKVIVRACDMQNHLAEEANAHLMLVVNRMMEYQNVINNLNKRVITLEEENKALKNKVENHIRKTTTDISQLNTKFKKTSKNLADHEATCKKEFIKLSS